METTTLKERYTAYKTQFPQARIFDIAKGLNTPELEILELSDVEKIVYLGTNFKGILQELKSLGKVMALTRNPHAVHEVKGVYDNVSFMDNAPMGIAHNELIDMRYFLSTWAFAYAVVFGSGNRTMHSIQFFDKYGHAVHKVYATNDSDLKAYETLVAKYQSAERRAPLALKTNSSKAPQNLTEDEIGAFQTSWLNMKDTHDFFGLLRKYNLSRQEAFALAPNGAAYRVENTSIVKMLEEVAEKNIPIMVFLGNEACLQIYSGGINKVVQMGDWYNVLDPNFNLHLQLSSIDEAWVVKKYTSDGIVTSLELFDKDGMQIMYCFGKRKPGIPELDSWRKVVANFKQV